MDLFLFFLMCVTIPSGCMFERWLMENAICRRLIYCCYFWKAADLVPTTSYLKSSAWMMTALTTFISTANAQMGVTGLRASRMSWDFPFFPFFFFSTFYACHPLIAHIIQYENSGKKVKVPSLRQLWNNGAGGLAFIKAPVKIHLRYFEVGGCE